MRRLARKTSAFAGAAWRISASFSHLGRCLLGTTGPNSKNQTSHRQLGTAPAANPFFSGILRGSARYFPPNPASAVCNNHLSRHSERGRNRDAWLGPASCQPRASRHRLFLPCSSSLRPRGTAAAAGRSWNLAKKLRFLAAVCWCCRWKHPNEKLSKAWPVKPGSCRAR